jgi:hypothetical protein
LRGEIQRRLRDTGLHLCLRDLAAEELLRQDEDVVRAALELVERVRVELGGLGELLADLLHDRQVRRVRRDERRRRVHACTALRVVEPAGERRARGEAEILADVHRRDEAGVRRESRAVLSGVAQAVAEYVSVCKLRRCAGC